MYVDFSYIKNDVLLALRYHFMRRKEIKIIRILLIILLSATITGYIFNVVTTAVLTGITFMILLLGWVCWYLLPLSVYKKTATFKDSIHLQYSDKELVIFSKINNFQRTISWNSFSRAVETKTFFFLYQDKKTFFLIPTTAFKTREAYSNFVSMLKEKFIMRHNKEAKQHPRTDFIF